MAAHGARMIQSIGFHEIENLASGRAGIYEIWMKTGIPLKVGISSDLRKRLMQHRASRQKALKLKPGGQWSNPGDVQSKASILAKHLYFDVSLVDDLELTLEADRKKFLEQRCYITFEYTANKQAARALEAARECTRQYRYLGTVCKR
jgi:hypothetical protein